ncbi:MAG: hypothetical protein L6Q29_01365 [Candidatus Pacebacteria bacterium]|nr:hypothetical protein [Candidatus Paceibacterota bacterium]NUQ57241.1 hypothetical protein [Candidatus Paceibacter sp.]
MKGKNFNVYKPVGISPLDAVKILRQKHPETEKEKVTYAGRLDPLAEGVLILLVGDAIQQKEKYLKLDKEYEAEILFGFKTDTYDILGLPQKIRQPLPMSRFNLDIGLGKFLGKNKMPLPPYSSYKIKGKPLFEWARKGKLKEIKIPEKEIEIYEIKLLELKKVGSEKLLEKIIKKIKVVQGDFRQEKILSQWQEKILPKICYRLKQEGFWVARIKIKCSSGTYVRSIAHKLGQNLKTGAVLLGLKRTKVGKFDIKDSIDIRRQ